MSDYSALDRTLHALALNFHTVKAASFDLECSLSRLQGADIANRRHVFVTGLARSGTSLLLRILHQTGIYVSQSYRDMPFVLAPRLWRKISAGWHRSGQSKERVHGDGLYVDFDSVEAFEEVFWQTFAGDLYVRDQRLLAHRVSADLASRFRDFVAAVLASQGTEERKRYLSKNNNNVLRLPGLARSLPKACIVVPFRTPVPHAQSLLRQHRNLGEAQISDPFVRKYMAWLGHYEFGRDFRPFVFGDAAPAAGEDTQQLDYWVRNWTRVYRGILSTLPESAILWDFDAFCTDPQAMATALAEYLDLDAGTLRSATNQIRAVASYEATEGIPKVDLDAAWDTHGELRRRALTSAV